MNCKKLESELWELKMVGSKIEEYTSRSHELARLCPHMVTTTFKRIEKYLGGLAPQIQGMVTSSNPATIQHAIRLAHQLTDQAVAQGTLPKRDKHAKLLTPPTSLSGTIISTKPLIQTNLPNNSHINLNLQKPLLHLLNPTKHWGPMSGRALNATSATPIISGIATRTAIYGVEKWATWPRIAGVNCGPLNKHHKKHPRVVSGVIN